MKCKKNKTSHYHSFIKQLVHSMQVLSVIGKFTYLISNKHFIAPVKINIIFILPDVLKTCQFATCSITRELLYQPQKFILNKNGHTEKFFSITQWKRWKQLLI